MQHKIVSFHYSFNGLHLQSLKKKTMASRPNLASFLSHGNNTKNQSAVKRDAGVVKKGYLAKRKSTGMKNRYFVLRSETNEVPAILEKYESEKKFSDGCQPTKKYILKDCNNIIQKTDKNNSYVIALYINKDCIALVTESESELQDWLRHLQIHKNSNLQNSNPKIEYEHVWQVEVLPRSLASTQNLTGQHFLCLTNWFLSLVRVSDPAQKKEFQLSSIKKCGNYDQFFFVILGRYSGIGCGELYLQTEDSFIAQNIYQSVSSAMNNFSSRSMSESNMKPRQRTTSDPQADFAISERRGRSDSVPNCRKPQPIRKHPFPSLEIIHQQQSPKFDPSDGRSFGSCLEETNLTSEKESAESGEESSNYLVMDPSVGKQNSSSALSSPREPLAEFQESSEDNTYMVMSPGTARERQTPNSLGISPRSFSTHPELVPTSSGGGHHGLCSPVSPSIGGFSLWRSGSIGTTPSPQTSSAPHSRNPSLLDDSYVNMTPPGSQGPQISHSKSDASSHYLDMRPGSTSASGNSERHRTMSTPTPSDEDSCYEACNSGSSSCTSGTPSDQRIHDIGVDERGDTPHSGMWNSLSPHYLGGDDPDCIGGPRPTRTNSVGSKPEQFKRKNRLDGAVPIGEPARVRAFSVGSRSIKFGVGCHGTGGGGGGGAQHPTGGLGEMFPSIKESGKQVKSKSSSAPMLGASPISHSWSGTPGNYFRGFIQNRNTMRETNLMELDFSKNKSYDYIPCEDKDKERKTSKERLWHTFTGHRHRSNSKSSGNSNNSKLGSESFSSRDKRVSESEASSRGLDIPYYAGDRNDYLQLDFTPSPRGGSNSDPMKGYLPMHPPNFLSSSLTTASELSMEKRGPRTSSFNETCLEMSSSLSSCASNDGYVDMTRGGSSGALTIASSSSSSNSINTPPVGGWLRRTSSSLYTPVVASQELPSPMEGLVNNEELDAGGDAKKKKKGSKRRSFRDSSKKKKNDAGLGGESPQEVTHKTKSQGPLATLTSLITRKPNNSKTPLSPRGSPLPPKGGKESTSPFSSLTRNNRKGKDLFSEIGEERETVSLSEDLSSSTPPSFSPQNSLRRRTLGGIETSPPPSFNVPKGEEKMLLSPLEGRLLRQVSHTEKENETKRISAYVNMEEAGGSLPSLNLIQKGNTKPLHFVEMRNYVNMQPGSSSPQLSPPATDNSSPKPSFYKSISSPLASKPLPEDSYMMMGGGESMKDNSSSYMMMSGGESMKESHVPCFPAAVAKRPEIPPTLLSSHSQPPTTLTFEKLSLKEDWHVGGSSSERSRSHSGPGAPDAAKGIKKTEDGRAASACSSPISYSPPTSPTLGSVSSMSSLSEGGLSSASSTCTVVNVGLKNLAGNPTTSSAPKSTTSHPVAATATTVSEPSIPPVDTQSSSSSIKSNEDDSLNYVSLDLGSKNKASSSSPRLASKVGGGPRASSGDEAPLSYVEIDFKKSEGLRTTSLARDSKRPH